MGFVSIPVQYTQCISQLAVYVPLRYMQLYDEYYRTSVAICSTKIIATKFDNNLMNSIFPKLVDIPQSYMLVLHGCAAAT